MNERISIVTDEISRDLGEVRAFLDEHRVGAVELRMVGDHRVPDLVARDRETLRAWARAGDPVVLAVSPGTFKCDRAETSEIDRQLREVLPRALDLATELDARFLVSFGFGNPAGAPPAEDVLDPLRAAADLCAGAGLPLLVENEPGHVAGTAGETRAFLDAADHPNLFANWDPLNSNELSETRLSAGLETLYPRVRHVHVKNGVLGRGERFAACCALGDGEIDWPAHLRRLAARGYGGYLGVETHYEPFCESSAVVLEELRAMLADIPVPETPWP